MVLWFYVQEHPSGSDFKASHIKATGPPLKVLLF